VNINKRSVGGHEAPGILGSYRRSSAWAAGVVMVASVAAWGQSEKHVPDTGPLEETWRYLVELFRMVVGL